MHSVARSARRVGIFHPEMYVIPRLWFLFICLLFGMEYRLKISIGRSCKLQPYANRHVNIDKMYSCKIEVEINARN